MEYKFLDKILSIEDNVLPESGKINHYLLKNNNAEIIKALDFLATEGKFLYIHGFLGTGKRQFINYVSDFVSKDVIKLEYYCKSGTVCDDILLMFLNIVEEITLSKIVNQTAKITTLSVKLQQYISSIKKPFLIVLHSYDDILEENRPAVVNFLNSILKNDNIKLIISSRAQLQDFLGGTNPDKRIFLKALNKEIFKEYINTNNIECTEDAIEDFYKYSRGYYYYTILTIKIVQAMGISLNDFLAKFIMSGMSFDSFLGFTYINLIPNTIRNFFWFLRTIRHGISINALAVLELYDEYSVGYLKNNLMIYQASDILYVQDYFQQDIDISIPLKTEIKLHKYIIKIYEKELKEQIQDRAILISRQALRKEIEYHKSRIEELQNKKEKPDVKAKEVLSKSVLKNTKEIKEEKTDINIQIEKAKKLSEEKKYTDAIESYLKIINDFNLDSNTLTEIRVELARLYKSIKDYSKAQHNYELAETYYTKTEQSINLNYLYYEMTELYYLMYKTQRAIDTAKKVIYSVDTPSSLFVDTCILLGNIYCDENKMEDANKYYIKALESADDNISDEAKSELYFKLALTYDEKDNDKKAIEYYKKCISVTKQNSYTALAYSNLGSCYFEDSNYKDAEECFIKAYNIEKENNNYDGIYYTSSHLAKMYIKNSPAKAYEYLMEAKKSAEFLNEEFYLLESTIALGDYYYSIKEKAKEAVEEYFKALNISKNNGDTVDINKIQERINDMKLRMDVEEFEEIEKKYE